MCNIFNEEIATASHYWKKVLLADIDIFIDFLVLQKQQKALEQ